MPQTVTCSSYMFRSLFSRNFSEKSFEFRATVKRNSENFLFGFAEKKMAVDRGQKRQKCFFLPGLYIHMVGFHLVTTWARNYDASSKLSKT